MPWPSSSKTSSSYSILLFVQRLPDDADVLRRDVGVLHALDDQQPALDVLHKVERRALPVAFRHFSGEPPIISSL